ncbi:MAG: hypothetical protein MZV65_46895 [Chromatiales bacterium]|nr:hypothetical protein [Chromatiales bacterium]
MIVALASVVGARYLAIGTGDTELYVFAGMLAAVVISRSGCSCSGARGRRTSSALSQPAGESPGVATMSENRYALKLPGGLLGRTRKRRQPASTRERGPVRPARDYRLRRASACAGGGRL